MNFYNSSTKQSATWERQWDLSDNSSMLTLYASPRFIGHGEMMNLTTYQSGVFLLGCLELHLTSSFWTAGWHSRRCRQLSSSLSGLTWWVTKQTLISSTESHEFFFAGRTVCNVASFGRIKVIAGEHRSCWYHIIPRQAIYLRSIPSFLTFENSRWS